MGYNSHRAQEIRNSAFGKEVREPIARSAEFMVEITERNMAELKRQTYYTLDVLKTESLARLGALRAEHNSRLSAISNKCATRIASMSLTPITGRDGYYTLVFTRENGT